MRVETPRLVMRRCLVFRAPVAVTASDAALVILRRRDAKLHPSSVVIATPHDALKNPDVVLDTAAPKKCHFPPQNQYQQLSSCILPILLKNELILKIMDAASVPDTKDIQQNNYVTVIPVEYPRNRFNNQNPEYMVEQYRTHDDYIQTEDLSSSQGALYSVSQRVPTVSASYSSLCATDTGYATEQTTFPGMQSDWERERTVSTTDTAKDANSDVLSDKQTNGKS
ncbi:hypothetical protein TcasGA2_TC033674 [Tribolium castaneum]|uniref:Uncharacterized protein n=1 Tax=Tribolium castaneum TaxID=7070 RepID=A0A139WED5_TRICA|nr:hypothetical protein TcasGA2_TC033674 [Tribolium castaneum]